MAWEGFELGGRSMVGLENLDLAIVVRIHTSQPYVVGLRQFCKAREVDSKTNLR